MRKAVTIAAVGDVTLAHPLLSSPDSLPLRLVRSADVAVANLEAPCSDRGTRADKLITMRSPAEGAAWVAGMGFHAVSLANNHAMDYGWEALDDTLAGCRAAGLLPFGAGSNLETAFAPAVVETATGVRVAFVGICTALPLGSGASHDRPGAAPLRAMQAFVVDAASAEEQPGMSPYVRTWCVPEDVAQAQAAIRRARQEADVVIAVTHWGVPPAFLAPFQQPLAEYQRPMARALIEAGADAIVGHHPHVIHGAELIDGKPVFYSLSNFAFHALTGELGLERPAPPYNMKAFGPDMRDSMVVVLEFGPDGFVGADVHPVYLNEQWESAAPDAATAARILERFAAMSRELGADVTVSAGVARLTSE